MTKFSTLLVATLAAAATLPAAGFAQSYANPPSTGFDRSAIAELGGTVRPVANWQAYGLDPLPVGLTYGLKDSRIVVIDATGAVVDIVRVVADLTSAESGMSF